MCTTAAMHMQPVSSQLTISPFLCQITLPHKAKAVELGLTGWVRNRRDGRVEVSGNCTWQRAEGQQQAAF